MIKNIFKNIIISTIILTLSLGGLSYPQTVKATGYSAVTEVGPSLWQQISSAVSNYATSFNTWYSRFQDSVLNTVATTLAKQLIRQLTADIVSWINNGFEGSPAFMTNPGGFFLDVADQATGAFLEKYGGPLADLCSPFSIDIRLSLAFKYHPRAQKRYKCTLGTVIANTKNAAENATLNGQRINKFVDGDFNEGGWPAFVSLSTEPQNNAYGAYLTANSELSVRVANAEVRQQNELNNGSGFLSWRNPKCKKEVRANNERVKKNFQDLEDGTADTGYDYQVALNGGEDTGWKMKNESDCPIETPGSLIFGQLNHQVGGPLRELELVDSINEIVNALAAQLVVQIMKKGLRNISGSGPSDTGSYLNQVQQEAAAGDNIQVNEIRSQLLSGIQPYIGSALEYKKNKDASLNVMIDIKTTYDRAKACYEARLATNPNDASAQAKIAEIDEKLKSDVVPLATQLLNEAKFADEKYTSLTNLVVKINAARTVNDLNIPTQNFNQLVQSGTLMTSKEVVESQQQLGQIRESAEPLLQDALRRLQECRITYGVSDLLGTTTPAFQ